VCVLDYSSTQLKEIKKAVIAINGHMIRHSIDGGEWNNNPNKRNKNVLFPVPGNLFRGAGSLRGMEEELVIYRYGYNNGVEMGCNSTYNNNKKLLLMEEKKKRKRR
jgi:hypothetical protein